MKKTVNAAFISGPEERAPDGTPYTGETWRLKHEPGARLLCFAALLRVFTPGQAARYIWSGNIQASVEGLKRLVEQRRWFGIINSFPLPREFGGGTIDVYFMTQRGFAALEKIAPKLAKHARPKQPRGVKRDRIPHDLLITETYLWHHERYLILEFLTEETIKSMLGKARWQRGETLQDYIPSEATGDCKLLVMRRDGSGQSFWVECEISLHLDADQIAAKPEKMDWFTICRHQADIIEAVKKRRAVILQDVRRPYPSATAKDMSENSLTQEQATDSSSPDNLGGVIEEITASQQTILNALDLLGGSATSEALAGILKADRSGISRSLKQLTLMGAVRCQDVQFQPGRERGRPGRLYFRANIEPMSLNARRNRLMLSRAVMAGTSCGFRVHSYDAATCILELRHEKALDEPSLIFIIDEPQLPVNEIKRRLILARARVVNGKATVVVAMTLKERMVEFSKMEPTVHIYDVSERIAVQE